MRVLITGGTGFVGSHTVKAVVDRGHEARLLVRSEAKVGPALEPLGVAIRPSEVHVGDVTDADAVDRALDGCDAVIHAASIVSLDVRETARVLEVNHKGAELVLGGAAARNMRKIVYVSSVSAMLGADTSYAASKAAADAYAQQLQDDNEPVSMTYPTMVLGPHDPNRGEAVTAWSTLLRGRLPGLPEGGTCIIDVRDVANVHARLLDEDAPPGRYIVAGHHVTTREIVAHLARLTERRLRAPIFPANLSLAAGRLGDRIQRLLPGNAKLPLTYEGVMTLTADPGLDDAPTRKALGLEWRPLDTTVADLVRWLVTEQLIEPRHAGALWNAGGRGDGA